MSDPHIPKQCVSSILPSLSLTTKSRGGGSPEGLSPVGDIV